MRKVDVAVIGAGQAGLATSFYLSQSGIDHVVLDRAGIADSWRRRRWDSFTLNIPNWSFRLPGFPYDGSDPDGFMTREEIVERFTRYAGLIDAPVEEHPATLTRRQPSSISLQSTLRTSSGRPASASTSTGSISTCTSAMATLGRRTESAAILACTSWGCG